MLNGIQGVNLYTHCSAGVKLYAHYYTWIEALCSLLYMV